MRLVGRPETNPYDWDDLRARVARARELQAEDRFDEAEILVRGARKVIERYEHRSARWGVMTLSLAGFRMGRGDWKGCLVIAREAAGSLLTSGRASSGLPYAEACMFIGRCYVELGQDARAIRFLRVASAAGQAWGDQGAWLADEADIQLGQALARLHRWADALRPLERARQVALGCGYSQATLRRITRLDATARVRSGKATEAWPVIRTGILDLRDDAMWSIALEAMAQIGTQFGDRMTIRLWYALEDDYESGTGSERPRPTSVTGV